MAAGRIPFDVDEAKLAPPIVRPASVEKSATIAGLLASAATFASIVAPAGYGKTTILGRCAEADKRPYAWVAIDGSDDDPLVLLRGIAVAINRIQPLASSVFEGLAGPGPSIWIRLPRLGNAIAGLKRPFVLALDDLHRIQNPLSFEVLARLFDYVPPGSQILAASREQPPLPLARWRAAGLLHEVGVTDLRLDGTEAEVLLRGANVVLGADDVVELTDITEGWPAGLYLAALSLRSGAADIKAVTRSTGDLRFVADYLLEEVLARMPADMAEFMVRTSVLEELTGPLCDAMLQTTGSARLLASMERLNSFVIALDSRSERYRYHHLFRQLLQNELLRTEPDAVTELSRRAMAWYLANNRPEDAITYGHAARESATVAGLVDRLAFPVCYDGRFATLDEWIGWFDDDQLTRFPALAIYGAWQHTMVGNGDAAERFATLAEGKVSSIPLSDGSPTIEPWVRIFRALTMRRGTERARADADRGLELLARDSIWRPTALNLRGIAHALLGWTDLARADLLAGAQLARASGGRQDVFTPLAELALLDVKEGDWLQAARRAEEARAIVDEGGLAGYPYSALVDVAVARVALHRSRHAELRAAMTRAHHLRPMLGDAVPWLAVQVATQLAHCHIALGEADAARTVLAEAAAVLHRRPDLGTLVGDVRDLRTRLAALTELSNTWGMTLTAAELRLMPYLATYLTVPEIATRLFLTSHTVRSEAKSIYRKLDANSRSEAVDRAVVLGLLEPMFNPRSGMAV